MSDALRALAEDPAFGGYRAFDREALWVPQPKQRAVIECEADVIGFAGEGNSGKSDLLAFYPLYKRAGAEALLLREEFGTLETIRRRIASVIKGPDLVTQKRVLWPHGSTTTFGHIKSWDDVRKHQGRARDFHLFDELAHIEEDWFRGLLPWNRSPVGAPCHVIAATNPPFPHPLTGEMKGEWTIDFFAPWVDDEYEGPTAESGEILFFVRGFDTELQVERDFQVPDREPVPRIDFGLTEDQDDPMLLPRSRTFIHASMSDNAYASKDYRANLQGANRAMREAILEGKWRRAMGIGDEYGVCYSSWVNAGVDRWREAVRELGDPPRGGKLRALGVDPSRGGSNATVIYPLWELPDGRPFLGKPVRQPGKIMPDGGAVAQLVIETITRLGVTKAQLREWDTEIRVDAVGIGSSVIDALKGRAPCKYKALDGKHTSWMRPRGVYGSVKIGNARAEYYWRLREALDPQIGTNLCVPPVANLRRELQVTRFEQTARGIMIEEKAAVRKRLHRSPDDSDAASYALAAPVSLHIAVA